MDHAVAQTAAPPKNDRQIRLAVEPLEVRDVPATVVYTDTFTWWNTGGAAEVVVTVTEDAVGYEGQYFWNYHVTSIGLNPSEYADLGMFAISVGDPDDVTGLGNSLGWDGYVGVLMDDPNLVSWHSGEFGSTIPISGSADFWFTTHPTEVVLSTGFASDPGFAIGVGGAVAAPIANALKVTTSDDSNDPTGGVISLREAIKYANGKGAGTDVRVITFDMTKVGSIITLKDELDPLKTDRNIYISGPGRTVLTVQRDTAEENFSLFTVQTTATAVIAGLTLLNGRSDVGAGIDSRGILTVTGCEIRNCYATGDGGGISATNGVLEVYDSNINGNTADGRGGGIRVSQAVSRFHIADSVVGLNYAKEGGGIWVRLVPDVVIDDVQVVGNRADTQGGGIWCSGTVTLSGSTNVNNNIVSNPAGQGGGVYVDAGTINLLDIIIGYNQGEKGDGMYLRTGGTRNPGVGGVTYQGDDQEATGP